MKVLGILAMIDSGETDWKVIVISCDDPLSQVLDDIGDVETHMPGALDAIRKWLRMYKTAVRHQTLWLLLVLSDNATIVPLTC